MENENNFNEINSNLNNNSNNSSNLNNINNNLNSNYSLNNQSNSRNNKGLIIVLILIILGLVGYIAYDKLNENSTNKCENQENNKKDNNKLNEDIDPAKIKDGEYLLEKNFSIKFNGSDLKVTHKLYYSDADFTFDYDVFINDKKITTDAVWVSASREDYQEIKKQFLETKSTVEVFKNENKRK